MIITKKHDGYSYSRTKMQDVVWGLVEKTDAGKINWHIITAADKPPLFSYEINNYTFLIGMIQPEQYTISIKLDGDTLPIDDQNDYVTYSSVRRLYESAQAHCQKLQEYMEAAMREIESL